MIHHFWNLGLIVTVGQLFRHFLLHVLGNQAFSGLFGKRGPQVTTLLNRQCLSLCIIRALWVAGSSAVGKDATEGDRLTPPDDPSSWITVSKS